MKWLSFLGTALWGVFNSTGFACAVVILWNCLFWAYESSQYIVGGMVAICMYTAAASFYVMATAVFESLIRTWRER